MGRHKIVIYSSNSMFSYTNYCIFMGETRQVVYMLNILALSKNNVEVRTFFTSFLNNIILSKHLKWFGNLL